MLAQRNCLPARSGRPSTHAAGTDQLCRNTPSCPNSRRGPAVDSHRPRRPLWLHLLRGCKCPAAVPIDPAFDRSGNDSPLDRPLEAIALTFSLSRTPVDLTDCRMGTLPPTTFNDETRLETYHDERDTPPICLGGYPSFTHEDPRRYNHPGARETSTCSPVTATMGSCGAIPASHSSPSTKTTARRDFSKVRYNGDCYEAFRIALAPGTPQ